MHLINNINISIFVFLILTLSFKIFASVLLLAQVLDLIGGEEINFAVARMLENISFTFLIVSCSLQLFKFYKILIRMLFYGRFISEPQYERFSTWAKYTYVVASTVFALKNLAFIIASFIKRDI